MELNNTFMRYASLVFIRSIIFFFFTYFSLTLPSLSFLNTGPTKPKPLLCFLCILSNPFYFFPLSFSLPVCGQVKVHWYISLLSSVSLRDLFVCVCGVPPLLLLTILYFTSSFIPLYVLIFVLTILCTHSFMINILLMHLIFLRFTVFFLFYS